MLTFEHFLADAANRGDAVNTLFEERLFSLVGLLHRIADSLAADEIPYEVVGGLAVLIHVEEASPEHTSLTRDVDLMIRRADLERVKAAAAKAGINILIHGDAESARNAVHLVFSGETGRAELKRIHGKDVMVTPVADLVRIKLTSNRDRDRVHIRSMDAAGLVTDEVTQKLTLELAARLKHIRETE